MLSLWASYEMQQPGISSEGRTKGIPTIHLPRLFRLHRTRHKLSPLFPISGLDVGGVEANGWEGLPRC